MLEASLVAALSPLVSGKVFPDVAPFGTAAPWITYQQFGGRAVNYVDDTLPGAINATVQISVWAPTRIAASTLARQVEDALRQSLAFQARPDSDQLARMDADLKLYGTNQDFSIWSAR